MSQNQKALFIIFGGTGDLAYRKLYPALYKLYTKNYLNDNFAVIGTARREWSDEHYQDIILESIDKIKASEQEALEFASHFRYQSHNVNDTNNYHTLRELADELDQEYNLEGNRIFYLSMSPNLFGTITSHLQKQKLITENGFNRVIIEKPFGTNFEDSNHLNNDILQSFDEEQIFRIDHYLGKHMIQSLIPLRFANPIFKHLWNKDNISNMQVTLAEDIGVEDRGGYYENSGALRDMVQNHVLQIVSMLYMDEPAKYNYDAIANEKVEALKNLVQVKDDNVKEKFVRGQYTSSPKTPDMRSYVSEFNVNEESKVETFVAGKIESANKAWENVPVYIRTGKRMKAKTTRIDIVFKNGPSSIFDAEELVDNVLTIHIGPEQGLSLQMNNKVTGHSFNINPINLAFDIDEDLPDDYEKLLLNALKGIKTSFVHWEEVAYSWKYVDAIRDAWQKDSSDLYNYPINTNGPKEAFELLEKDGHRWIW